VKISPDFTENSNGEEASITSKMEKVFKPAGIEPSEEKRDHRLEAENQN